MTRRPISNVAASVHARLLNRATRDIDLHGTVAPLTDMIEMARACVQLECEDDGIRFAADSLCGERIHLAADYEGVRVRCIAHLGNAHVVLQIDIGFGDVIIPGVLRIEYPTLLGFTAPRLLGYPPETFISEKFQALVALEMANTRLKDFLDIWTLSQELPFDGAMLAESVAATFSRRRTPLPTAPPIALTEAFHSHPDKQAQWQAYLRKGRFRGQAPALHDVALQIGVFLMPVVEAINAGARPDQHWPPGGPWSAGASGVEGPTPHEPEG